MQDSSNSKITTQRFYHSLSDAELSAYLTFLKSPAVGAFNSSVWNGLDVTFGDAAQRLGRKLAGTKP